MSMKRTWFLMLFLLIGSVASNAAANDTWHGNLYLAGGDYWRARLPVVVTNETDHAMDGVTIDVGVEPTGSTAALIGVAAESIRVCDRRGVESLFSVQDADGIPCRTGKIPLGARLLFATACPPRESATYYVYFENPHAGQVATYLTGHAALVNGDMERGHGNVPTGWTRDEGDAQHQTVWTHAVAKSGTHSLKTIVTASAEPTWIATRQAGIQLLGGGHYRFEAWVKGDGVVGHAGWYLHIGSSINRMMRAPTLVAGTGTFEWTKVQFDFEAPVEANLLDVGTVLRGSGVAWFDAAKLTLLQPTRQRWERHDVERLTLQQIGSERPNYWPKEFRRSVAVRLFNFTRAAAPSRLVAVDVSSVVARLKGQFRADRLQLVHNGQVQPAAVVGNSLLFQSDCPAQSVKKFQLEFDPVEVDSSGGSRPQTNLLAHANLVRNGSFEAGRELPDDWQATGAAATDGVTLALVRPGKPGAGSRCARLHVPQRAPAAWRGWRQRVPVQPGHTYLLTGWVRCQNIEDGDVRIHVHLLDADGKLVRNNPYASVSQSIQGSTEWTLLSGQFVLPDDAAQFEIHLTMHGHGTVWHDDIMLAEVHPGRLGRMTCRSLLPGRLAVWPVPAVVKVFPDDPPPTTAEKLQVECARNEWETLQLAIRSGSAIDAAQLQVTSAETSTGRRLENVKVTVVGYVPIDHASSYYRSDQPAWQRMVPTTPGQCDGWPGPWPDPLLPTDRLQLDANSTRSVWITFRVPADAAAGDYHGTVALVHAGKTLATKPYGVKVHDFALPQFSRFTAMYDVRQGPGGQHWGATFDNWYPKVVDFMAARRLCPDRIQPEPSMRYANGKVVADFSQYDKVASWYFDTLHLPRSYAPRLFYLFGWGHPPKTFLGQQPYEGKPPFADADRSKLRPEYKRVYQACLKVYWDHIKQMGWQDKIVLYISDEPYDRHDYIRQQMRALCDMIHEVDPHIPIYASTWRHIPDWDGYLNIWGIGHDGRVPVDVMSARRKSGDRLWFTTDGQMCTDTPYCGVERLLPTYCFKHGVEAYEFWGVGWLTHDPYAFGWHAYINQSGEPGEHHWVRYPNGDGFLVYPGKPIGYLGIVSSIRLEQAREGVEDYEYWSLLRARIAAARQAGKDTTSAQRALDQALDLVKIPNAGGRYSSKILPDPRRFMQCRRAVAVAIDTLKP